MATFKVGQRVRLVNCESTPNPGFRQCTGDEVVILGALGADPMFPACYQISIPANYIGRAAMTFVPPFRLSPLTDPGADAFIERMKKLGREPVNAPVRAPETVEVPK